MPAGKTTGSFVSPAGKTVQVDSSRSFTWYDRQWSNAGRNEDSLPQNWTWFELTLGSGPNTVGAKYSIWFIPFGNTTKGIATVRKEIGEHTVIPATFVETGKTWTSKNTNATYAQAWIISLANNLKLDVTSFTGDQELWSADLSQVAYEGFVEAKGTKNGRPVSGFGLVEIIPSL